MKNKKKKKKIDNSTEKISSTKLKKQNNIDKGNEEKNKSKSKMRKKSKIFSAFTFLTCRYLGTRYKGEVPESNSFSFITAIVIFILFFCFFCHFLAYIFLTLIEKPISKFNVQVLSFHQTNQIIKFLDITQAKNSNFAYFFRNSLMNQYEKIYNTNDKNFYNAIGCYNSIINDFSILSLYQYKDGQNTKNSHKYQKYKKRFLVNLEKILDEYEDRNVTKKCFTRKQCNHGFRRRRRVILYKIPNRIDFYPKLAYYYYTYKNFNELKSTEKNLSKLKSIYYRYQNMVNQEQQARSMVYIDYVISGYGKNKLTKEAKIKQFFYTYFIYKYTTKIIEMENDLHPDTFCKNTDIFEKYSSIKFNVEEKYTKEYDSLLEKKCNYNFEEPQW